MTFARPIKIVLLAALATLMVVPANAGPFRGDALIVEGARIEGRIQIDFEQNFADFALDMRELQGAFAEGRISILPNPPVPAAGEEPAHSVGCIEIDAGSRGKDKGCTIKFSVVTIDPAMTAATILLGFESDKFPGFMIDVTLLLEQNGQITPVVEGGEPPTVSAEGVTADNEVLFMRDARVVAGSVRSRGLGERDGSFGGAVASVSRAQMYRGLSLDLDADITCLVSLSNNCIAP